MYKNHGAALKTFAIGVLLASGLVACKNDTNAAQAEVAAAPVEEKAAAPASASGERSMEEFSARLESARPGISIVGTEATEVEGIIRADINGGRPIYVVKGTDYFFLGELYQVSDSGLVNVSEQEKVGVRKELLAKADVKDMIVFPAEGETKQHITVFTDVDCGYCQKLHREVPELNAMGIEVRYMAFPRAGVGSPSYKKITSAWCAENPRDALTKVKNREEIPENVCEGNPVEAQYALGKQMGVTGTPTIMMDDGESIPGYVPAKNLAERLGL